MLWNTRFFMFLWRVGNALWTWGIHNPVLCCLVLCCLLKSMQTSGFVLPWPPDGGGTHSN